MISNGPLKVLSLLFLVAAIGMIVFESSESLSWEDAKSLFQADNRGAGGEQQRDEQPSPADDGADDGSGPTAEPAAPSQDAATQQPPGAASSRLVVGVLGPVPTAQQIHSLSEVPWLESQVSRAFDQSAEFACRLLLPDVAVKSLMTSLPTGRRGVLGRMPAVTIGLEVDSAARSKLPQASRGAIESYLRDHRLAIEPIVYQDEQGQPYFGTDCRAAFYPVAAPTTTIKAEPMIEDAIGRFRALGVLREHPEADGRTLVMAFRYAQAEHDRIAKADKPSQVTELLFLHLTSKSPDKLPELEVFATTDSRQSLHRLATGQSILTETLPVISATIRFDSFVLMGLYPAKPVVTGVRQRATAVMSIDTVLKLTKHADPQDRLTFQQLLDRFTSITGQE